MKTKKIPSFLLIFSLTVGASLILGFLSFGGMYALWPVLPLAFAAFGLSVAYEGEIYLQNIKGAFHKITGRDYLQRHLANRYLLDHFPSEDVLKNQPNTLPSFFVDYHAQLLALEEFKRVKLDAASRKRKKQLKQRLRDMENWFALQLFAQDNAEDLTDYERELRGWLADHQQDKSLALLRSRQTLYRAVQVVSTLAALFMGVGTTYLLVGEFAAIPLLSTIPFGVLPAIILPMAIVAGTAYGFLTYNAITDMINNDTLRQWYYRLRNDFQKGVTTKNVFMAATAVLLLALATALTICTAGTWWTVAKHAQPLFAWMAKLPSFVMGIINPLITGFSALIFNLENTADSLTIIYSALSSGRDFFKNAFNQFLQWCNELHTQENWGQMINPFRLLLKITIVPLRILFFLGHLISIGVTSDRVPGIPEALSAILGIISEGFEDMHYFMPHAHHHDNPDFHHILQDRLSSETGHSHTTDLPTRLLKLLFSPIYCLAALWDYGFSQLNKDDTNQRRALRDLNEAWDKQRGNPVDDSEEKDVQVGNTPSPEWQTEQALYHLRLYRQTHLNGVIVGRAAANEKAEKIKHLEANLRLCNDAVTAYDVIAEEAKGNNQTYTRHRFFDQGKTKTQEFLEQLSDRIAPPAA